LKTLLIARYWLRSSPWSWTLWT